VGTDFSYRIALDDMRYVADGRSLNDPLRRQVLDGFFESRRG
jgi:hypothetical protein